MRLLRPAPRWLPFEGGKAFFFEKKKQKTFAIRLAWPMSIRTAQAK
jgi:hypothetical protein